MSIKQKVLIICTHNSGRSQIAEAYLSMIGGERIHVESAGLEPAETVNPLVVEVMKEEGFDLSNKKTQSVFELFKKGSIFNHVITVCGDTELQCPIFPGISQRWHMPFPDPSTVTGSRELLRRAIENIVRNAARYTSRNTRVEISLVTRQKEAEIIIADYGPGVPEQDLPHLFVPFYRVAEARERQSGGVGIGLAIAEQAVKANGGRVIARNREGRKGLVVTIILPLPA